MKKKERRKRQLSQQLHIRKERGATFVGFRPITFASKKHPSRAKRKEMERSEIGRSFLIRQTGTKGFVLWNNRV